MSSGKLLNSIYDPKNQLLACDYNHDGEFFVAAGTDTVVRVYDEETKQLKIELEGHTGKIFCSKFLKSEQDPNMIASGGWDFSVKLWDIR